MTKFIDAYSKTTGAKQVVPAAWLDRSDAPFSDLSKTPRQKARETAKAETTNPAAPTATELNAGIDLSCDILSSDFTWTAADSDKVSEPALCDTNNSNAIGKGNHTTGLTLWRKFLTAGGPDTANETGWGALSEKGAEVYGYARETDKDSTEAWAATDEIYLGGLVVTDTAQRTDGTGFIKRRIPLEPQRMHDNIVVAAGA